MGVCDEKVLDNDVIWGCGKRGVQLVKIMTMGRGRGGRMEPVRGNNQCLQSDRYWKMCDSIPPKDLLINTHLHLNYLFSKTPH